MKNYTVAFDLDGTLVDTAPDLVRATNHVLGLVEVPAADPDDLKNSISFGARAMIERGLRTGGRDPDEVDMDRLFDEFVTYYAAHIADESKPYPGAEAALEFLKSKGARLTICTNKREDLSRKLLKELGLHPFFDAVVGRDTLPVHKPDAGHLIGAIILADGNPGRAIMVGDSETDLKTARGAGIPMIGCAFGYSPTPMDTLAPEVVIDGYDGLEEAVSLALKALV